MPRHTRLTNNNCPHHIIQRGHNQQVVFARDDDSRQYLETLQQWKSKPGCKVFAYCLLTNHVHLVIDPATQAENLSLPVKRIAGRQTKEGKINLALFLEYLCHGFPMTGFIYRRLSPHKFTPVPWRTPNGPLDAENFCSLTGYFLGGASDLDREAEIIFLANSSVPVSWGN